ncbi:hypothetical protein L8106_07611 [Lyngbya sp. PCC 8106]|nr:hypothetical protein L8106_07611 [Lyngbya sp. PCC 8106]
MRVNRRDRYGRAGFVLPTVTMVMLVVVLLSLAIMFRAFDRAQDAQYTRVSQQTLNAVAPAIDRAKAKVTQALQEVTEVSDEEIYKILTTSRFVFGDEKVVQVRYDVDGKGGINPAGATEKINDNEQVETAWRFPFDTDNNGKFDSFILYGIFSTTPQQGKPRNPLNARTQPLPSLDARKECAFVSGGVDDLVTEEGLTPTRGKFKKSIFAYATTVPVTEEMMQAQNLPDREYEASLQANSPAASPVEYQQDWQIKPLNGVVYRDDLNINPGPAFNFNGSLLTQSNLIVSPFGNNITIYQASAKKSCFYDPELSKITVGGNVINGMVDTDEQKPVQVHLYQGEDDPKVAEISENNQSVAGNAAKVAMYNDEPYRELIEEKVKAQLAQDLSTDPVKVKAIVDRVSNEEGDAAVEKTRRDQLERHYQALEPKIPYGEVSVKPDQLQATEPTDETRKTGEENELGDRVLVGNNQPALKEEENGQLVVAEQVLGTWTDTETDRTRPTQAEPLPEAGDLSRNGFWEKAAARLPKSFIEGVGGLRVVTGGGVYERESSFLPLPQVKGSIPDPAGNPYYLYNDPATAATDEEFPIVWPDTMPMSPPGQNSEVFDNDPGTLAWDSTILASNWPLTTTNSPPPANSIDPNTPKYAKGDLKMRATAVYHYAQDAFDPSNDPPDLDQRPIACVSSYYDPSTLITAFNETGLGWNEDPDTTRQGGRSNNGIVYGPPATARPENASTVAGGLLGGTTPSDLEKQANYVFPNGRFANKPLRDALLRDEDNRSLADKAAIDATLCSLGILGIGTETNGFTLGGVPAYLSAFDGAIKEVTLLNAREVKAIHKDNDTTEVDETFTLSSPLTGTEKASVINTQYDLPLEDRLPIEVRVTQIDLGILRNTPIANTNADVKDELDPEYMLPYSGIIYATRDDALPDRSFREDDGTGIMDEDKSKALSPVDFVLDPTRKPNGIMLVHGGSLGRNDSQAPTSTEDVLKEKGLTLISNLPVYIKADDRNGVASDSGNIDARGTFNQHTQEEFEEDFDWNINSFYNGRKTLNASFACRKGDPIRKELQKPCTEGDNWRPVTVFADAITLLTDEYQEGFRNEGDFDLRNNAGNAVVGYDLNGNGSIGTNSVNETTFGIDLTGDGDTNDDVPENQVTAKAARQLNGFNAYNDFAVNGLSSWDFDFDGPGGTGTRYRAYTDELYSMNRNTALDSSYFNNYVTPVQRRGTFSEYVMEMCLKPSVSACEPGDWVVVDKDGGASKTASEAFINGDSYADIDGSGTTARLASPEYQRYPRRVAFKRTTSPPENELDFPSGSSPIPLGIRSNNIIQATFADAATTPDTPENALWFQTNNNGARNWKASNPLWYYDPLANKPTDTPATVPATVQQPLLVPVLQLHASRETPGGTTFPVTNNKAQENTRWLPKTPRNDYEYNLVFGAGDVPARPDETNGGLQNLARFLENWQQKRSGKDSKSTTTIAGSFVQSGRSEYSTAPYFGLREDDDGTIFGETGNDAKYNVANAGGKIGYFAPPNRSWGFDLGLYYQPPDYFSRKFARLDKDAEGDLIVQQYFRELPQDDPWVKGILCAKVKENGENVAPDVIRGSLDCSEGYDD